MSRLHQLALSLVPGIGNVVARALVNDLGGVEEVFRARKKDLVRTHRVGLRTAELLLNSETFRRAEEELAFMERNNIRLYFFNEPGYPVRLRQCHDAPLLLFAKGPADLNKKRVVSVVGTRNSTGYGKELVQELVGGLNSLDVLVVSGLAYGIDSKVHRVCLKYDVPTVGVLGHGLDRIYPAQNRATAEKMLEKGGWLSEFPSGTVPDRENFPKRNRIIAGMADATVVVEAGITGGALITADLANSYDREVFAYPGNVGNEYSSGCNLLISSQRAHLVTCAEDIIFLMGWNAAKGKPPAQLSLELHVTEEESRLLRVLQDGPSEVDELRIKSGQPTAAFVALLLNLELKGLVRTLPGKRYALAGRN